MGELTDGQPLYPGESEIDQLYVIQVTRARSRASACTHMQTKGFRILSSSTQWVVDRWGGGRERIGHVCLLECASNDRLHARVRTDCRA